MTDFSFADVFLSPLGDDYWSGRLAEPNADRSDGPFASLGRARAALRSQGQPGTAWIRAGDYCLSESFFLNAADSGTSYRAYPGELPRILGGRPVTGFCPVRDPAVKERLDPAAREQVVELDLNALGITDFGRLRSRGFARSVSMGGFGQDSAAPYQNPAAHLEVFYNGAALTLARWPNEGFVTIAGMVQPQPDEHGGTLGTLESGFYYAGDRPRRWKSGQEVWLHGYWAYDWANSYERAACIDVEQRLVKTAPPYGHYGFRTGNRFFFLNVLEELDSPGEYYVDQAAGILYLWPPFPLEGAEVLVSVCEAALFALEGASNVVIQGLTFEAGRAEGITVTGGEKVRIEGCRLRNLGTDGVVINDGLRHTVSGCEITATGDSGVSASGGERRSLTPCQHHIENNHIFAIARWSRTYVPAIHLAGVGLTAAHNLIHDLPHMAIVYWGNEIVLEYNHIHHVVMETGDAGAIYTGRDFTTRGNVVRFNYIHDTGGYGMGAMGVYLDDCVSGQTVYGNLFVRVQRAVMIGGGSDIRVENNIFVDCQPAVWVDARGMDPAPVWVNMVHEIMRKRYEAMRPHEPPFRERYPELLELHLDSLFAPRSAIPPLNDRVVRNICAGGRWLESDWHPGAQAYLTWQDNFTTGDPQFVDAAHADYRLSPTSPAWDMGFQPIPLEKMAPG